MSEIKKLKIFKIFKYNNKNYSFLSDTKIEVDFINKNVGEKIEVEQIFASNKGVQNKKITMEILEHKQLEKVMGMKFRRRKNSTGTTFGHRRKVTILGEVI